jgi:hypothetical protein
MRKTVYFCLITLVCLLGANAAHSQNDSLLRFCIKNMTDQYISDGQQYLSILNGNEIAEFRATFFGGTTYRIAACSGLTNGNIIFTVLDTERNELFSNRYYKNAPYWDFKFTSTMECIVEAHLDPNGPKSGFAILLIGFKK